MGVDPSQIDCHEEEAGLEEHAASQDNPSVDFLKPPLWPSIGDVQFDFAASQTSLDS